MHVPRSQPLAMPMKRDSTGMPTERPEFGLSSSIFTQDISRAFQFLDKTEVGLTHVNMMTAYREPQLSFGGVKSSGHGIPESGKTGIEFFTEHKVAFINYA
mgnify:CR=1 FL=1